MDNSKRHDEHEKTQLEAALQDALNAFLIDRDGNVLLDRFGVALGVMRGIENRLVDKAADIVAKKRT